MIRALVLIGCLAPSAAFAQPNFEQAARLRAIHHIEHRQYVTMPRQQHVMISQQRAPSSVATRAGQDAFTAIQEVVEILTADPKTDWSKVNIDALRQHLIDMNNVTLNAQVTNVPIDGGMIFALTGDGPVRDSIRRMTMVPPRWTASMAGTSKQPNSRTGPISLCMRPRRIWKSCAVSAFSASWRSACIIRNTT